jgi:hypothetical protein
MLSIVNSCFKNFTVFEMVQLMYCAVAFEPQQLVREAREVYLALEETIESGNLCGPKEVFSRLKDADITYHSF